MLNSSSTIWNSMHSTPSLEKTWRGSVFLGHSDNFPDFFLQILKSKLVWTLRVLFTEIGVLASRVNLLNSAAFIQFSLLNRICYFKSLKLKCESSRFTFSESAKDNTDFSSCTVFHWTWILLSRFMAWMSGSSSSQLPWDIFPDGWILPYLIITQSTSTFTSQLLRKLNQFYIPGNGKN